MKILWIDDEIELLKPFIYLLQQEGYEVKTATSGEDGANLAGKEVLQGALGGRHCLEPFQVDSELGQ